MKSYVVSLVYVRFRLFSIKLSLKSLHIDAVSESEALGIAIKECHEEYKDYKMKSYVVLPIKTS